MTLGTDANTATFVASDGLQAHNITITATLDYSARTFNVVGVRLDGVTVTEAIVGPNAGTVSGVGVYKSISSIYTTANGPTEGLEVGIGRRFAVNGNRVKGISLTLSTDTGTLTLRDGPTSTGDLVGKFVYPVMPSTVSPLAEEAVPNDGFWTPNKLYGHFTSGIKSVRIKYT